MTRDRGTVKGSSVVLNTIAAILETCGGPSLAPRLTSPKMGGEVMTAAAFRDSKRKTDRMVFVSFHLLQLLPFRATARRILFEAECLERLNFIHAQVFDADLL